MYYRFLYSKPKLEINCTQKRYLVCGGSDQGYIGNTFRELFPDKVQPKIAEANLICKHIFDLLGSGPKKLTPEAERYRPIEWHSDFKSGYRWNPKTFYRNIRYGHVEGVDVKIPWELSRFQHLNKLGQAYILTRDRKYSEEFVNQITDWIKNNPVGFGVNWYYAMDVAIRAVNWLVSMEYFYKNDNIPEDFIEKFYSSIYQHGKFIRSHLEYSSQLTMNHYIANIVGLFFISVYCPFFKKSKEWQGFALRELSKEIEKQVYSDGCSFEASTSYHGLVLEMLFLAKLLGDRAGIIFPKVYRNRLRKMFEFSLYCVKPNGMIPQIGDNDSGRFLVFSKRPILEHKYLLNLAAIYYEDSRFKVSKFDFYEESFWVFGNKGKELYDNLPVRKQPIVPKSFPDAGWFTIRRNNDYCFISCGSNGQNGKGGHAHNDKLSFELMLYGQDIIVDPGTYVYTSHPKERNKFRSTKYHNTITFNGYEQNEISANAIFSLPDRVKIASAALTETDENITFQGGIRYLDLTHKRRIRLDKDSCTWTIADCISSGKMVNARLTLHLSPEVLFDKGSIFSKTTNKRIASIEIPGHSIEKSKYDYSPEYGVKVRAECLVVNISSINSVKTINTYIHRR